MARMLNSGFAFNGGAVLWASAPMPEHNSSAQRLISTPPKQPLLSFLRTNKRYILPPSGFESLGRDVPLHQIIEHDSPAGSTSYFDCLGWAAGFWLSMGT